MIVGIPFSNDQKPNLLRASRLGYAAMLDWDKLTVFMPYHTNPPTDKHL